MKVKIKETTEVIKEIEADLPYYYKKDFYPDRGESCIYGCIYETKSFAIHEDIRDDGETIYKFESDIYQSIAQGGMSSYFKPEYKSTKEEYEQAKLVALKFIEQF